MTRGKRAGTRDDSKDVAQRHLDYQRTFSTEAGKRTLTRILDLFGYWDHDTQYPETRRAAIALLEDGGWLDDENKTTIVDGYLKARQVNNIAVIEGEEK